MPRYNIDKDDLIKLYIDKDKTSYQIAEIYGCHRKCIISRLKKMGIPIKRHKRKYSYFYCQKLTEEQKEILYGGILGDGCIHLHHNGINSCRYIETHSEKQLGYLKWKMAKLDNFISVKEPYLIDNSKNNSFSNGFSYRFNTVLHSEFTQLRELFYQDGKKHVPLFKLTPLSFAIWYYDDGSIEKKGNRIVISSLDFDDKSIDNLLKMLRDDLYLQAKIAERRWGKIKTKKGKAIIFNKENTEKILEMIKKYKIKSVEYKILIKESCNAESKKTR
jgi:recombination protein RecA